MAALAVELDLSRGGPQLHAAITAAVSAMQTAASSFTPSAAQSGAHGLVEQLATALQACLLTRFAPAYLAEAFVASRLGGAHGDTFGTLSSALVEASAGQVIERSLPV